MMPDNSFESSYGAIKISDSTGQDEDRNAFVSLTPNYLVLYLLNPFIWRIVIEFLLFFHANIKDKRPYKKVIWWRWILIANVLQNGISMTEDKVE